MRNDHHLRTGQSTGNVDRGKTGSGVQTGAVRGCHWTFNAIRECLLPTSLVSFRYVLRSIQALERDQTCHAECSYSSLNPLCFIS